MDTATYHSISAGGETKPANYQSTNPNYRNYSTFRHLPICFGLAWLGMLRLFIAQSVWFLQVGSVGVDECDDCRIASRYLGVQPLLVDRGRGAMGVWVGEPPTEALRGTRYAFPRCHAMMSVSWRNSDESFFTWTLSLLYLIRQVLYRNANAGNRSRSHCR